MSSFDSIHNNTKNYEKIAFADLRYQFYVLKTNMNILKDS